MKKQPRYGKQPPEASIQAVTTDDLRRVMNAREAYLKGHITRLLQKLGASSVLADTIFYNGLAEGVIEETKRTGLLKDCPIYQLAAVRKP